MFFLYLYRFRICIDSVPASFSVISFLNEEGFSYTTFWNTRSRYLRVAVVFQIYSNFLPNAACVYAFIFILLSQERLAAAGPFIVQLSHCLFATLVA